MSQNLPSAASALRVNLSMMNTSSESLRARNVFIVHQFTCTFYEQLDRVAQLVTCMATYACLTADLGVASSIPTRSHSFVEYHEIISTVILFPSADSSKKGCCQLHARVCARSTG